MQMFVSVIFWVYYVYVWMNICFHVCKGPKTKWGAFPWLFTPLAWDTISHWTIYLVGWLAKVHQLQGFTCVCSLPMLLKEEARVHILTCNPEAERERGEKEKKEREITKTNKARGQYTPPSTGPHHLSCSTNWKWSIQTYERMGEGRYHSHHYMDHLAMS